MDDRMVRLLGAIGKSVAQWADKELNGDKTHVLEIDYTGLSEGDAAIKRQAHFLTLFLQENQPVPLPAARNIAARVGIRTGWSKLYDPPNGTPLLALNDGKLELTKKGRARLDEAIAKGLI